ncbi:glycerol uptake operon antiterminator [Salsuginibacillus halophilus]|uniref:Glycerol uptake operon antiterminator regulatory protein n=1 Tax=Salsuginibacillus halophilus TaxID=517424 RepID=A0A2P8HG49_9BACI|nr:glycerol-3-phosphate responsive antiterminator [Salsuginibacillus halophilus]PSL45197.1 glycerol uptake operon antiterminator [Salsuginibacillus halophilus]
MFNQQTTLPAARHMKDIEKIMISDYEYIVLLNSRVAQLKSITQMAREKHKKLLVHADLVQGLTGDEFAAQMLCQQIRPHGIISTRKQMLLTAKKHNLLAVQRLFLLDSLALETSYRLVSEVEPDAIEVLPGVIPKMIEEVREETKKPVIAGGLIREKSDVDTALEAGAQAVTTTRMELWR